MTVGLAEDQKTEILAELPSSALSTPEYREWITVIEQKMAESELCVDRHTGEDKGFP
jgi:hypothetical protein